MSTTLAQTRPATLSSISPNLAVVDNAHTQIEVTNGQIVVASAWSVVFLIMIVLAVTDQALGRWIELAARY